MSSYTLNKKSVYKVLFVTDLSVSSRIAFTKFLHFVKGKASDIILCHIRKFPLKPFISDDSAIKGTESLPDYFSIYQNEWAQSEVASLLAEINKVNINFKMVTVLEESRHSLSRSIEDIVERENVSLVGLASHIMHFERFVKGSVPLALLSTHKFNLWVCGPKCVSSLTTKM